MDGHRFFDEATIDTLARTLWGEARSEGRLGMEAVASVVMNRVAVAKARNGYWWGNDVLGVCQKPFQFSCWNANDPQRPKVVAVTDRNIHFMTALRVARRAVYGTLADATKGATHYHTLDILPHWAKGRAACAIIGHHMFYRLEE